MNRTTSEYAARLLAARKKRDALGEYVYSQVMRVESLLDKLKDKHPQIFEDAEYDEAHETLVAIRAFMEEFK